MSKSKTVSSNFMWRFFERIGAQGVTFVVAIILARLLEPEVYGTIALVTVFTHILQVFVDSGFGTALIQKKDADDIDFSTVFYFNVAMCTVLYALLFFCAPFIADFYKSPDLVPVIRVLGLTLIISGLKDVQRAYVSRNMLFKRFFWSTLGGTIGAAILGITIAYMGGGIWALVAQHLFNLVVDTTILWITVKWRPKLVFSFSRLKSLFSFGWRMLMSTLADTVYNNLRQLIIGKMYTGKELAFFNKGKHYPNLIITNINTSLDSVLLPTLAKEQDNIDRVCSMTRRAIKVSCYLIMPMMVGLGVCGESLVRLMLTEKWLPCVFYMRIFCITYAFYPIHTANLNAIKAMGRSDIFLKLEIIKKAIGLAVLLSTMWFGVEAMAYSLLFTTVINQIINSWPNKKLLGYSYIDQIKDLLPNIILSVIMGVIVYTITFIGLNDIVTLLIQVPLGVAIYVLGSKLMRIDSFDYMLGTLKGFISKRKTKGESN